MLVFNSTMIIAIDHLQMFADLMVFTNWHQSSHFMIVFPVLINHIETINLNFVSAMLFFPRSYSEIIMNFILLLFRVFINKKNHGTSLEYQSCLR